MFRLIRMLAIKAFGLFRRFRSAAPANPYEAILFGYVKATVAQFFFREVPRGVA